RLLRRRFGFRDEPAEAVVAETAQELFLAGVSPVERTDPDTGTVGDCRDRRLRIREEHLAGGIQDDHVAPGGLAAATGPGSGFGRFRHEFKIALERIVPLCYRSERSIPF